MCYFQNLNLIRSSFARLAGNRASWLARITREETLRIARSTKAKFAVQFDWLHGQEMIRKKINFSPRNSSTLIFLYCREILFYFSIFEFNLYKIYRIKTIRIYFLLTKTNRIYFTAGKNKQNLLFCWQKQAEFIFLLTKTNRIYFSADQNKQNFLFC